MMTKYIDVEKHDLLQLWHVADYYMDEYKDAHPDVLANPKDVKTVAFNQDDAFLYDIRKQYLKEDENGN